MVTNITLFHEISLIPYENLSSVKIAVLPDLNEITLSLGTWQ